MEHRLVAPQQLWVIIFQTAFIKGLQLALICVGGGCSVVIHHGTISVPVIEYIEEISQIQQTCQILSYCQTGIV